MADLPPFSLTQPRRDMNTFMGRYQYFNNAIDPRRCFHSGPEILAAQRLLADFRSVQENNAAIGNKTGVAAAVALTDRAKLWEARAVVEACVHPKTGETLNPLFRMSAFIPVNIFIVPFMMLPSTMASPARQIFIHWFNQSYNCAVNYSNRSSESVPLATLGLAYGTAVGVSVGAALAGTRLMKRYGTAASTTATLIRATVPFSACVFASWANVAVTRQSEWLGDGIEIKDNDGTVHGKSRAAGRDGLGMCCVSRFMWNVPPMLLPPLLLLPFRRIPYFAASPRRQSVLEGLFVLLGLGIGIAPGLAAFNPVVSIAASKLEPQFQNLKKKDGTPITEFTFYKGL